MTLGIDNMNEINCNNKDLLIFDLDGVVYKGSKIITHVKESFERFYTLDKKIAFFTNNATLTVDNYIDKLSSLGIKCHTDQIYTSATITAKALKEKYPNGADIFVIGEEGLMITLEQVGFNIINRDFSAEDVINTETIKSNLVVAGLDWNFSYNKLAAATLLLSRGAIFFATNTDSTFPHHKGNLPGAGSIISAIATAAGIENIKSFGKPSPAGIQQILNDYQIDKSEAVMFGDRPETDILVAKRSGISSVLLLTGITTNKNVNNIPEKYKPDVILNNLSEF